MLFKSSEAEKAHQYLDVLFGKEKSVRIDTVKERRSLSQNRYAHGIVFSVFAIELGWTLDEAKQYFKKKFLTYYKGKEAFVKETKNLNTKEMEDFLECCRVHASKDHGCYIPKPNEVTEDILKEIFKYEKYLL